MGRAQRKSIVHELWRMLEGPRATYRALGMAFLSVGRADSAKKVLELAESSKTCDSK